MPLTFTSAILVAVLCLLVAAILGGLIIYFLMNEPLKKLKNELHTLRQEFSAYRTRSEERQNELQSQIEERGQKLLEAKDSYEALTRDRDKLSKEHSNLQLDFINLQKEFAALEKDLDTERNKLGESQKSLQQAQADYYKVQAGLETLSEASDFQEGVYEGIRLDLAEANAALAKLEKAHKALKKSCKEENDTLKKALADAKGDISELKEDLQEEQEEADKYAKKLAALEKIREKAKTFDYSTIGVASEEEKDDLKLIKGIGPFIEEKLNALGIFTFMQISKFKKSDVEQVTKAIEFFPGRIERDHWIDQAKERVKK